jgi:glycosyltransferase involved in cell wall biosynthesis
MAERSISLITAVYNKPRELQFILEACSRQSVKDFELIIADDGSDSGVAELIAKARTRLKYPVLHVWHEDSGWRKNAILNKAVRAASTPYLVFIDGDCIPHHRFLEDHFSERDPNKVLGGRRAEMSRRWSDALTVDSIRSGAYERMGIREWMDALRGKALAVEEAIHVENRKLRKLLHSQKRGLLGSNFSLHKINLEAINGFDELYHGPGCGEDSDIDYRLGLQGITSKILRHRAIQFHVHHPKTVISEESYNRFLQVKQTRNPRCSHGLVTLTA